MATALKDQTILITGGNTGIGKETARGLAKLGARVVIACRDTAKAAVTRDEIVKSTGNERVEVMSLDLGSLASVRSFAEDFRAKHDALHVLVNNAGVWNRERRTTTDGFEQTFGVNHLGHFALTLELSELLVKSAPARVLNVSSTLHYNATMNFDDPQFERRSFSGPTAYNESKLANVLFSNELSERIKHRGVTSNSLHPGVVHTELARAYPKFLTSIFHLFTISPERGALTSVHLASAPELSEVSGRYYDTCKEKTASRRALDAASQKRLWELSEKLTGQSAPAW